MTRVLLGLGSNCRREYHLCAALDALAERFGPLQLSRVFESESVGCTAANYFNLVVALETDLAPGALNAWLKSLEDLHGRDRRIRREEQNLDLDLLAWGDRAGRVDGIELPRADILHNAYVLRPLAELMPQWRHPLLLRTSGELWHSWRGDQRLWPIEFHWRGRRISSPDTLDPEQRAIS